MSQRNEVREIEALNLAAIAAARDVIYMENQYLASRGVAEAIAARLREADGPEVVIILPRSSESRLEIESMDSARERLVRLLRKADLHGRLGVYWPAAGGGVSVYVHSKVIVVDGRLLRIGSSNFNNRSLGFDSECDVAIEADPALPNCAEVQRRDPLHPRQSGGRASGSHRRGFRDEVERRGAFRYGIEELAQRGSFAAQVDRHDGLRRRESVRGERSHGPRPRAAVDRAEHAEARRSGGDVAVATLAGRRAVSEAARPLTGHRRCRSTTSGR